MSLLVHLDDNATISVVVVVVDNEPFFLESHVEAYFCFPQHSVLGIYFYSIPCFCNVSLSE